MQKADYLTLYGKARESVDVAKISESYLRQNKVIENSKYYAEAEKKAFHKLVNLLKGKGYVHEDIELIIADYGGAISDIYAELGIKIGTRMEMEHLCKKE